MRKIKYKTNYIRNIVSTLTTAGFIVVKEEESISIVAGSEGDYDKLIMLLHTTNLHSLTYQTNEATKEVTLFDSRV